MIVEGIETAEQRDLLQQLGCSFGQGHYFSRPLREQVMTTLLPQATLPLLT